MSALKYVYVPLEVAAVPTTGKCIANSWWVYVPRKGLAFYDMYGDLRPQCNTDRRIVDMAMKGWTDGAAEVVWMDAVYTGAARLEANACRNRKDLK